jgi:hypothetical protein
MECRDYRISFGVRNSFLKIVEPGDKGYERLLFLRLYSFVSFVTLHWDYALTLTSTSKSKDELLYAKFNDVIETCMQTENLILFGDFGGRMNAERNALELT